MNSESPKKKQKLSPIKQLLEGEAMVDIKLVIVEKDCVRSTRNSQVWSLIGTDGNDFITISFWEAPIVEKFVRAFGLDFVVGFFIFLFFKFFSQNKTYAFKNFFVAKSNDSFNYGSVGVELRGRDSSSVTLLALDTSINLPDFAYFDFLKSKLAINESDFSPCLLKNLRKGDAIV